MASLIRSAKVGHRVGASSFSTMASIFRGIKDAAVASSMHQQGGGLADELFARGWCGYGSPEAPSPWLSFPRASSTNPVATQVAPSPPTSLDEDYLLEELYSRGWFDGEREFNLPTEGIVDAAVMEEVNARGWSTLTHQQKSKLALSANPGLDSIEHGLDEIVLDELYARGWITMTRHLNESASGKDGLEDVVVEELFARGWTWDASTKQVAKKGIVTEIPAGSKQVSDDALLSELFVRGWEASTQEASLADVTEGGQLGEEIFERGW